MPRKIAQTALNATTLDILNVIRKNASLDYQQNVPVATKTNVREVGSVIYGTPAFANQFINSLVNRIAMVRVKSATFNNPYSVLKKGYLEFGETVEEIFVGISRVFEYDPEKAEKREFKRYLPDARSAFHTMNWRVVYPVTIQDNDLKMAFLSLNGVEDLIAKIVDQVYTAAEYDEFLLFKYMLIKSIARGELKPVSIGDPTNLKQAATVFRGTSNLLPFMLTDYNEAGVKNNTPRSRQVIFMDAMFNAQFDVDVLASAFNMDKATYVGRLFLIDNWTDFDNERFAVIKENSDGIEDITPDELALLADVKAVAIDEDWFQVYDNLSKFTEKYVASGLYWNYFYHQWKTVSHSPFANAVVYVTTPTDFLAPATVTAVITGKSVSEDATVFTLEIKEGNFQGMNFVQTEALTTAGIGVQKYGALLIPASQAATDITLVVNIAGTEYTGATTINAASNVGDEVSLTKA